LYPLGAAAKRSSRSIHYRALGLGFTSGRLRGVCLGLTPGFLRGLLPGRFGAVMLAKDYFRVGRIFFVTDRAWTSAANEVR
jgi:hypothetical protein